MTLPERIAVSSGFLQGRTARAIIGLASVCAYVLAYRLLLHSLGGSAGIIAVVPIALVAWRFGLRSGVATALLAISISTLLFHFVGESRWDALLAGSALPDSLVLLVIAASIGYAHDVSRRANALPTQLGWLGRTFAKSGDVIAIFDATSLRCVQANTAACYKLGYTLDELFDLTATDLIHAAEQTILLATLDTARQGLELETIVDMHLQRKDGTTYPVEARWHFVASETPPVFIATMRDMTERKRMERHHTVFSALGHQLSAATTAEAAARIIATAADDLVGWDAYALSLYDAATGWCAACWASTSSTASGSKSPTIEASSSLALSND